jgi:uncharacterized protein YndB with AHSA1/START domain
MVSINKEAPVLARAEIEIEADQETVWNILVDVEAWPNWNPDVKLCLAHGEMEPGTQFNGKPDWETLHPYCKMLNHPIF